MHMLNTVLWGHQPQTLNGYFSVNYRNNYINNDEKQLSTDGENRFFTSKLRFQIYVIFSSPLRTHFLNFKAANLFGKINSK